MIRLFNVYYPIRTLVLLGGEALLVWTSFLIAAIVRHPEDSYVMLNYEGGYLKILWRSNLICASEFTYSGWESARNGSSMVCERAQN